MITLTGELRDALNITDPQIIIDVSLTSNITFNDINDSSVFPMRFYEWNYVYIEDFNRYYFVRNVTVTSKNLVILNLHVDVLYSFDNFINRQKAYISRNELYYDPLLPDERRIIKNTSIVTEFEPINISSGSMVNFEFTTNPITPIPFDATKLNCVALCYKSTLSALQIQENLTQHSNLLNRDIKNQFNPATCIYTVISASAMAGLLERLYTDDTTRSYCGGIYVYPFYIPTDNFWGNPSTYEIEIGSQQYSGTSSCKMSMGLSTDMILCDFTVDTNGGFTENDFNDLEPYSKYQMYIPFYGWWDFPYNELRNKRIIVSYVVNYKTGSATVNVTNKTDEMIIFSTTCQLGIQIDLTSTNLKEVIDRDRQNQMNLTLSIIGSAIAIGGGILTANPVALGVGLSSGGLAIGKSIAEYTENQRTNYSRANIQFGDKVTALYSYLTVKIRKITPILQYSLTSDFLHTNGGVMNEYEEISHVNGYTEIADIIYNFNNTDVQPLQNELDEITSLLKTGIYV